MLDIMTLVSPPTNIGSDTEFLRGRSYLYIMNMRGPRNEPTIFRDVATNYGKCSIRTDLSRYANRCTFYKHTLEVV